MHCLCLQLGSGFMTCVVSEFVSEAVVHEARYFA